MDNNIKQIQKSGKNSVNLQIQTMNGDIVNTEKIEINYKGESKIPDEENFYYKYHAVHTYKGKKVIEVRPRQGFWYPFVSGIPIAEKDNTKLEIIFGPAGKPPRFGTSYISSRLSADDKKIWFLLGEGQASSTQSYYIVYENEPSIIIFGPEVGKKMRLDVSKINKE